MEGEERDIVDGKPYFGKWYGSYVLINEEIPFETREENRTFLAYKINLEQHCRALFAGFDLRHEQFVEKQPFLGEVFYKQFITLAFKFLVWGRAWKVKKLERKGVVRFKRVTRSGKRKWIKIRGKAGTNIPKYAL